MFKAIYAFSPFISSWSFFHKNGTLYDALFKPFLDFFKGCLNLQKDDLTFILHGSAGKQTSLKYFGFTLLKKLSIVDKTHWENLSFVFNQLISLT